MPEYLGNFDSKISALFWLNVSLKVLVFLFHLASTLDPGPCPDQYIDHLQVFSINPLKFF